MVKADSVLDLVGRFYDAALLPDTQQIWPELLISFERHIPGGRAVLFLQDAHAAKVDLFIAPSYDPTAIQAYAKYYCTTNPWTKAMALRAQGSIHSGEMLVSEKSMVNTEFYNDWLKPQGLHSGGGCTIFKEGARMMVLTFLKPFGIESVTKEEFQLLDVLEPHLRRAAQLRRQFGEVELRARWTADALDRLSVGVIVLVPPQRVVYMNSIATDILRHTGGVTIDSKGGLRAKSAAESQKLTSLIANALRTVQHSGLGAGGGITISGGDVEPPLSILVAPFDPMKAAHNATIPTVMLFVTVQGREPVGRLEMLSDLYGLTKAEALVACKLVRGFYPKEIAAAHGVSLSTIRTQIQSVLQQLHVRRQSELVSKIIMDVGMFW